MSDYIVTATAAQASIRAFAIDATALVEKARTLHQTTPVMTAALGRLLAAGAMMGSMMKGKDDVLTLQISGDGPAQGLTVTANSRGEVKGYAVNPQAERPINAKGKLDVGGAIGNGTLTVIRDMGLKEPYNGICNLVSGEIAEDLAYYFNVSEQTPSAVGLGVRVKPDGSVENAGGFIIQLMPDASDETVNQLEAQVEKIDSITAMMGRGMTPEDILEAILSPMGLEWTGKQLAAFVCDCSEDRVSRALSAISLKELDAMIADGEPIEVRCHFCGKAYHFSVEALKAIREQAAGQKIKKIQVHDGLNQ
ncbi:MAG: Hsp33 family molecular chaperone HslO [Pseudoramibacter sp.]